MHQTLGEQFQDFANFGQKHDVYWYADECDQNGHDLSNICFGLKKGYLVSYSIDILSRHFTKIPVCGDLRP